MSTSSSSQQHQEHWECDYCGENRPSHSFFNGAMCSEECERLDRADTLLNILEHDHRLCYSCGRRLKTIERPPETTTLVIGPVRHDAVPNTAKDVLVGYEYPTEHASHGEISLDVVDDPEVDGRPMSDRVGHGVTCSCGATDHRDADPTIRDRYALEIAHNFQETIADLRAEGKTDERIHRDVHFERLILGDTHREALSKALVL